ncbi:LacI family DNA-binding transcriptional regulator [Kiritimatiella glycovorans]|uniref:Arabinose metabolism transcriptional repressor n=1 Tax=Kiritimatiella glycovorans TaxID=1307763 RepID=A0A0G3EMT9_9BACT|nr:LacI family DNA-binding transcriptional regulator [Kiritimatiella glycovorans]AKJ65429.1 Arabinose metabolism transcriptional repressor [Kiritimatiella glycovorans]
MGTRTQSKHRVISAELLGRIRAGKLKPGERLPSERALAAEYGVARLTARRALSDLEERGLVRRNGQRGTTVLDDLNREARTLTLLCSAAPFSITEETIRLVLQKAEDRDYGVRVIRVMENDEKPMLEALKVGNPTMIFGWPEEISPYGRLERAVRNAGDHVALIAGRIEGDPVPTVTCDDRRGVKMAVDHLRKAGHKKIALIAPNIDPAHSVLSVQIETWREAVCDVMNEDEMRRHCIAFDSQYAKHALIETFNRLKKYLRAAESDSVTALLCLTEELATAALAACRAKGRSVPDDMSIMEYAWTPRSELFNPPRTGVNPHLDRHVEIAFDLLEQCRAGKTPSGLHRLVRPELIERETVGPMMRSCPQVRAAGPGP